VALVVNAFARRIVGWFVSCTMTTDFVLEALERALYALQPDKSEDLIHHSDRGAQFTSGDYQRYLGSNRLVTSMSSVGHCGYNAACEGFFGMLRRERIHHRRYRSQNEARAEVFDYIERFHNPRMRRRVAAQDRKLSAALKPSVEIG